MVGTRCFVEGCGNVFRKDKHVSFHKFPSDENIVECWMNEIMKHGFIVNNSITSNSRICSDHFTAASYVSSGSKRKMLLYNAVPTIFTNQANLSQNVGPVQSKRRKMEQPVTQLEASSSSCAWPTQDNVVSVVRQKLPEPQQSYKKILPKPLQEHTTTHCKDKSNNVDFIIVYDDTAPETRHNETLHLLDQIDSPQHVEQPSATDKDAIKITTENETLRRKTKRDSRKVKNTKISKGNSLLRRQHTYQRQRNAIRALRNEVKKKEKYIQRIEQTIGKEMMERCSKKEKFLKKLFSTINTILQGEEDGEAQSTILLDQLKNFGKKPTGFRFSQWTIKYSIILQGRSSSLYEFIRDEGMLILPSRQTLLSYTGTSKGEVGVNDLIRSRLRMLYQGLAPHERLVSLQVDEMQIKKALVYVRARQKFCGHVDYGVVDMSAETSTSAEKTTVNNGKRVGVAKNIYKEIEHLSIEEDRAGMKGQTNDLVNRTGIVEVDEESSIEDGEELNDNDVINESNNGLTEKDVAKPEIELANSLINFLISGLTKKFCTVVGSWPVKGLTGENLYALTLNVIQEVEAVGFTVVRVVGDNAKVNVKLFKLLHKKTDTKSYVVTHPLDKNRKLFLSYDYTHLIKNVRNQLIDRVFNINGEHVMFSPIVSLYCHQRKFNLRLIRNLTEKQVNPTNLQRMKVGWAVDIFRPEMIGALELLLYYGIPGFENVGSLINFLKIFWRWWEIHDVSNSTQHVFKRMENKKPFYAKDDERLDWLEEEFPLWLKNWKDKTTTAQEFLTNETYDALLTTSKSTAECIRYLLDQGLLYVLTRKFSTDDIEALHGSIRRHCGANDHPDAAAALSAQESIVRTGLARASIACNVPLYTAKRTPSHSVQLINSLNKKNEIKIRAKEYLLKYSGDYLKILEELDRNAVTPPQDLQAAVVAMTAGYVIRTLNEAEFCGDCCDALCTQPSTSAYVALIKFQDRGGLIYPSKTFSSRMWTVYKFIDKMLPNVFDCSHLLQDLADYLLPRLLKCSDLKCDDPSRDVEKTKTGEVIQHNQEMLLYALKKFISPMLKNHAQVVTDLNALPPITYNKPNKRKVLKLR